VQVRDASDCNRAAVDSRLQSHARQRRVAAVAGADDADTGRIDQSVRNQLRHTVGQVSLHFAPPLAEARGKKLPA